MVLWLEHGSELLFSIVRKAHFCPPRLELGSRARKEAGRIAYKRDRMMGRQAHTMPILHSTLIHMAKRVMVPRAQVSDCY